MRYDAWSLPTRDDLGFEYDTEIDKFTNFIDAPALMERAGFIDIMSQFGVPTRLTRARDRSINRRSHCRSIPAIDRLVATYRSAARREGVPGRLAAAMRAGEPIPMPIIVRQYGVEWCLGGNTRLSVAEVLRVEPGAMVLLLDLDQPHVLNAIYPLQAA